MPPTMGGLGPAYMPPPQQLQLFGLQVPPYVPQVRRRAWY